MASVCESRPVVSISRETMEVILEQLYYKSGLINPE
jgi:hypothetical protein